ncbi:hypothetical protein KO02_09110 [Sphingobacterium sp. ML3W]|uniref:RNA polymerase sigma factor n=1 Tax=Sphingobacterium sp. ML3W TaxID=1538644 RepID=UPI0004F86E5E|nr:sigma-70 family RNA polymerase sigma factor [Sphingobacterium sp. ML3W]AIM36839.1 hypothetical protein KO02_09110 [Sphingobacterium sp. ML3W]
MENYEDKILITRLKNSNIEAFNAIYWKYQSRLYANIYKLLKNSDATKDILQDVFVTLWEKRNDIDSNREIIGWLFTVSYNKSINLLKNNIRKSLIFDEYNEDLQVETNDTVDVEKDHLDLLDKAINQLSPQKRKVFDLCKLQGKTYEETAIELNISKHTVKEYLSGAVANVKSYVRLNGQPSGTTLLYLLYLYQSYNS